MVSGAVPVVPDRFQVAVAVLWNHRFNDDVDRTGLT